MPGSDLQDAFVAAYSPYVRARVEALGVDPEMVGEAIAAGRDWLAAELGSLMALDPREQRRSPLEVFRMALAYPTRELEERGIAGVERDETTAAALPGDTFDMAPASSRELGEAAWKAHVAWGIAKAGSVAGVVPVAEHTEPVAAVIALFSTNVMDRVTIGGAVGGAGYELAVWRNPAALAAGLSGDLPAMALVDLQHPAADDAIRTLTARGVPTLAFGPHVDDFALSRAVALGAADALPRSRFFRRLPELLPERA